MSLDDPFGNCPPLPLDPLPNDETTGNRLWIGNIDSRITEYDLVKVLQKHGKVVSFNFLFHKTGPLIGQPRGYCFVTYESKEQAQNALKCLDGKLALTKKLSVKWANSQTNYDSGLPEEKHCQEKDKQTTKCELSVASKIHAIEAKLKMMEENSEQEDVSVPILHVINMTNETNKSSNQPSSTCKRRPYSRPTGRRKPYSK
ncbi:Putative RNA-binding protein 18 [Chamberlinius hualienensis]